MLENIFFWLILHCKRIQGREPQLTGYQCNVLSFCFFLSHKG